MRIIHDFIEVAECGYFFKLLKASETQHELLCDHIL